MQRWGKFSFLEAFFKLIFPDSCICCGEVLEAGSRWVCCRCTYDLPEIASYSSSSNIVSARLYGRFPYKHAVALFSFKNENKIQSIMHAIKYGNSPMLAHFLGLHCGKILSDNSLSTEIDIVVAVPLHIKKAKIRGYNQSAYFARGIAESSGIAYNEDCMKRVRFTETQTRKSSLERFLNVQSAFEVSNPEELSGKSVLLVDDVLTTGATLEACSDALLKAKVRDISVATIAIAE